MYWRSRPGVVTWTGRESGYGNMVEISHGDGLVTRYAHNKANLVAPGDLVPRRANRPDRLNGAFHRSPCTLRGLQERPLGRSFQLRSPHPPLVLAFSSLVRVAATMPRRISPMSKVNYDD